MSRTVVVTGASGFVGQNAVRALLDRGFEVHALHRGRGKAVPPATWHAVDLHDAAAMAALLRHLAPSHLLHLGWDVAREDYVVAASNREWELTTRRLMRSFMDAGGRRFVGVGTCLEYQMGTTTPLREDSPIEPSTPYGLAKDACRRDLESLSLLSRSGWAWARLFNVYGPHEKAGRLVPSLAEAIWTGKRARLGPGHYVRDYLHVEDVGDALAAVLDSELQGPVNVASGEAVTITQIVDQMAMLTGRKDIAEVGANPRREGDPAFIVADTSRLRGDLDWHPKIAMKEGLARTLEWWRSTLGSVM